MQAPDGGYIVCGITYSADGDVVGGSGYADYWVIKLDASGTMEWQKVLGGGAEDDSYTVAFTNDGGYIVGGQTLSVDGDVTGLHGNGNFPDAWVLKLTAAGQIEWQKAFGGSFSEGILNIIQTTDGGYIFTGAAFSSNGDVTSNHGEEDIWVVKISASGNLEWQKALGGSQYDIPGRVIEVDGGYMVSGSTNSNNGQITSNHGGYDYWLIKLDPSGNLLWQKTYGGSADDYCNGLSAIDGGYLLSGSSTSADGDISAALGGSDCWIVRVDEEGTMLWDKSVGTSGWESAVNAYEVADGFMIAGQGSFFQELGSDYYVVKLGQEELGVAEMHKTVSVYPNPVSSILNINSDETISNISIYDMQGRSVLTKIQTENTAKIDVSGLVPNIYIVEAITPSGKQVARIIIE
ncbi:hypothetical protein HYN59_02190 [Flavobacterium album]|uniref:Secretion system C-terminal sorting domain-containing protein n=1 Tax=Flavobacterium album TaxID=2175091 RepID=A0A2S1QU89_9FLAO|nr:T9SS type A sorting domain-containing protein [Flavobacterium album]AWH83992.1 hypothetical protein HYN59_02190 [Flavobacterium album]